MKTIIAIGGGSIKDKTTYKIDEYIATLAKRRAGEKRAYGLFIGTASHDCMPAFNSFRKTFTSVHDIKADCLLTINVETSFEKMDEKFSKADFIYVGGGDTLFMLDTWEKRQVLPRILDAYERGVIICGLSAGAVCWFENMYTDSEILNGTSGEYKFYKGLGLLKGTCSPHYNIRKSDFDLAVKNNKVLSSYAIEDDACLVFEDGEFVKSISSGGKAYKVYFDNGKVVSEEL